MVKDMYTEDSKKLRKEIEEDIVNEKVFHVHRLEESVVFKCHYYQKQSIDSM